MGRRKAVLLIGGADLEGATARCIRHCEEQGYEVTSIVYECKNNSDKWRDAYAALASGEADELVHCGWPDVHVAAAGQGVRRPPNGPPESAVRRPQRLR
ncbi:hypothetical protein L083_0394 [Actinoplanes sp. N902-109]|nr:hypothetical protein L083_0394 [Actinoplanes sp. N902-109]